MSLFSSCLGVFEQVEEKEEGCCNCSYSFCENNASSSSSSSSISTSNDASAYCHCCCLPNYCGCCGDNQQQDSPSSHENDLFLCTANLLSDDSGTEDPNYMESQQQLLNMLEEEKAYHREELALAAATIGSANNAYSTSSSSSVWRCGYRPTWSSISFACGGWLQFYEFGK